jgi:hypothetical protein
VKNRWAAAAFRQGENQHVDGLDLIVEVTVTPLPGLNRYARAAARTGPISASAG